MTFQNVFWNIWSTHKNIILISSSEIPSVVLRNRVSFMYISLLFWMCEIRAEVNCMVSNSQLRQAALVFNLNAFIIPTLMHQSPLFWGHNFLGVTWSFYHFFLPGPVPINQFQITSLPAPWSDEFSDASRMDSLRILIRTWERHQLLCNHDIILLYNTHYTIQCSRFTYVWYSF